MADFCKQCSEEIFGKDFRELAGLRTQADYAEGLGACVICEGCGPVVVDTDGRCCSPDCIKKHGAAVEEPKT